MFNPILRCAEPYLVRHALAPQAALVTRGVRSAELLFVLAAYGKNPPAVASFSVGLRLEPSRGRVVLSRTPANLAHPFPYAVSGLLDAIVFLGESECLS